MVAARDRRTRKRGDSLVLFEYDTPWGTKKILLESKGSAVIGEGSRWRLTVCRENCDTPLWLRGGTMYQIFPDRFCRSGKTPLPENKPAAEYHSRWGEEPDWEPDSDGKIENTTFSAATSRASKRSSAISRASASPAYI